MLPSLSIAQYGISVNPHIHAANFEPTHLSLCIRRYIVSATVFIRNVVLPELCCFPLDLCCALCSGFLPHSDLRRTLRNFLSFRFRMMCHCTSGNLDGLLYRSQIILRLVVVLLQHFSLEFDCLLVCLWLPSSRFLLLGVKTSRVAQWCEVVGNVGSLPHLCEDTGGRTHTKNPEGKRKKWTGLFGPRKKLRRLLFLFFAPMFMHIGHFSCPSATRPRRRGLAVELLHNTVPH